MELFHLRYFLSVAKHENFSRAAEELFISQPSVSKAILSLEKELGVSLFTRKGKRIQLNGTGQALQKRLLPVMGVLDNLPHELQVVSGCSRSTILLNVLAASSLLPDMLVKFRAIHPYIDFQITQKDRSAKCDLSICSTLPEAIPSNGTLVLSEEILLAVPVSSTLALRDSVTLNELKGENFIMLSKNRSMREITDHFFLSCGFSPQFSFESDIPSTIRDLVAAGLGVSLWPEVTWGKIPTEKAKLLHISNPHCRRNIYVISEDQTALSEQSLLFMAFVKDYFRTLLHDS